jgi:Transglycosylase SLT domain
MSKASVFLLGLSFLAASAPFAFAQTAIPVEADIATNFDTHVAEAARHFGLPNDLILAVIHVESAGDAGAVSQAGAMGLMQIMPGTWADLRRRYRLGTDPFDARDNIFAGTAYLREMYDQFGSPGFLAAYNAGPGRYADHLATNRPLPHETRDYVAKLVEMLGTNTPVANKIPARERTNWRTAPLFVAPSLANPDAPEGLGASGSEASDLLDLVPRIPGSSAVSDDLFVAPIADRAAP